MTKLGILFFRNSLLRTTRNEYCPEFCPPLSRQRRREIKSSSDFAFNLFPPPVPFEHTSTHVLWKKKLATDKGGRTRVFFFTPAIPRLLSYNTLLVHKVCKCPGKLLPPPPRQRPRLEKERACRLRPGRFLSLGPSAAHSSMGPIESSLCLPDLTLSVS